MVVGIAGTIAPAREVPIFGAGDLPLYLNLNLIVPVVSAAVVIVLAVVIICYLRGRNTPIKGRDKTHYKPHPSFITHFFSISVSFRTWRHLSTDDDQRLKSWFCSKFGFR